MPPAVRAWFPERIGFATAVYTNGLIIGEILPVALMALVLPLVGGSWQWGFVVWSVPVAVIAVLVLALAPASANGPTSAARRRWWPDWNDPLIWRLGIMLGTINATYFATNAFLPDYLTEQRAKRLDQRGAHRIEWRPVAGIRACCLLSPAGWSARRGPTLSAGCSACSRPPASCSVPAPGS